MHYLLSSKQQLVRGQIVDILEHVAAKESDISKLGNSNLYKVFKIHFHFWSAQYLSKENGKLNQTLFNVAKKEKKVRNVTFFRECRCLNTYRTLLIRFSQTCLQINTVDLYVLNVETVANQQQQKKKGVNDEHFFIRAVEASGAMSTPAAHASLSFCSFLLSKFVTVEFLLEIMLSPVCLL